MSEKSLPPPVVLDADRHKSTTRRRWQWALILPVLVMWYLYGAVVAPSNTSAELAMRDWARCPHQPDPLYPKMSWNMSEEELDRSTELFVQAVKIPTQSYDDNGEPGQDDRWAPFFDFQQWLRRSFPLVHERANVEYVNTLGVVATLEGSDSALKPLVLMSHYDVVPVPDATLDRWTYAPFSAHNDGTYIWGRGAADDKTLLVAQWEALTHLLQSGFNPRRTVILTHGFDEEEVFARRGQGHIAPLLEERYGKDGILMLVDEGSGVNDDFYGGTFAMPGMGEKGYMDVLISVGTPGGHSSVPPEHTGIGIMAQIIADLERHPFESKLTADSPFLTSLMCGAKHAPAFPKKWAKLLAEPKKWPRLVDILAASSPSSHALIGTTQAVDVISGGVKINALPELVTAEVNYRIDFSESIASTQKHIQRVIGQLAERRNMTFSAWEGKGEGERYISVDLFGPALEPAPRTPMSGGVWDVFAGTARAVFKGANGSEIIVAPSASTGNTDCKMYYNLTKNVYRFMGSPFATSGNGVHTVNEKSSIAGHHGTVQWIHALVQNADGYTGEE